MALACGGDLGFETLDELHEEMGALLAPREPVGRAPTAEPAAPGRRNPRELQLFTYPLLVDDGACPSGPTS